MNTEKQKNKKNSFLITAGIFYFFFIVLILKYTPILMQDGLPGLILNFGDFNIKDLIKFNWNIKYFLIGSLIYLIVVSLIYYSDRGIRHNDAYGSSEWGSIKKLNKKFKDKKKSFNIILSKELRMGLDGYKTQRNANVIVLGGSGAGKTRGYVLPNLMQLNSSYIVLDPKGEIVRQAGVMLEDAGYELKILDLKEMEKSNGYNPFKYLRKQQDVMTLVNNYISNTTPKDSKSSDPFWEKSEVMLLYALVFLLYEGARPEEQNFGSICDLLGEIDVLEDESRGNQRLSAIDEVFKWHGENNPDSLAVRYFNDFRTKAPGKTARTILLTVAVRMAPFYLPEVRRVMSHDEMDFSNLGKRKQAIFCVIPDDDKTFNFLVSMVYTQCFQELYLIADREYHGRLPIPVQFIMDEFANVKTPENFIELLSTMRSRGISCSIILQTIASLKKEFGEHEYEGIIGNCDEFVYLGGNEPSSHKYISEMLGKETINISTDSRTKSSQGSTSKNYQQTGRELLTESEVRELNRNKSIIFISGEKPIIDNKFSLKNHKNYKHITDGGGRPYAY